MILENKKKDTEDSKEIQEKKEEKKIKRKRFGDLLIRYC